eukprot:1539976-Rhodomonas_salina.1
MSAHSRLVRAENVGGALESDVSEADLNTLRLPFSLEAMELLSLFCWTCAACVFGFFATVAACEALDKLLDRTSSQRYVSEFIGESRLMVAVWCLAFGVWSFGAWCLVFGVWCLVRCLVLGAGFFGGWRLVPGGGIHAMISRADQHMGLLCSAWAQRFAGSSGFLQCAA